MIWCCEWGCYCDRFVHIIIWYNEQWHKCGQELLPVYAWHIWIADRKLKYKSEWMTWQLGMFSIQVWGIFILAQYKTYQFHVSSTSMIKFKLPRTPAYTMFTLRPGQGELPPPYLCHPLFPEPQMIGTCPTQLHYKIKICIIYDLCIRLCVNVAEDDWCYLHVQVFHMCNEGCKSSNPIKTCSHAEIDKSILGENHHSGSWVYLLSLHPRPLPSDHFIISFFKCCDLVPL